MNRLFLLYFPGHFDGDEIIGIYDDIQSLKRAFERVCADTEHRYEIFLQDRYTKLTIEEFNRENETFEEVFPNDLW